MMPRLFSLCQNMAIAVLIVFVCALAGCNDFALRHFGGLRKESSEEGPPRPAPVLAISNPPILARPNGEDGLKPAGFNAPRELPQALLPQGGLPGGQRFEHPLRVLHQRAVQRYAGMDAYSFRLKRREVVKGSEQPEEVLLVKLRREPYSVALQWLGEKSKGRGVVYVHGRYDNKMQVCMAAGDMFPFSPAGMRLSFSPDDKLVKAKSRYPITEMGFGTLIERYGRLVDAIEKGDPREGTAKYLFQLKRPEFMMPVEAVHQALPPGADPLLPKGGERWWYFDANSGLPVLVITKDQEREVEYYCHDQIQWPIRLEDNDFNPDRLWQK